MLNKFCRLVWLKSPEISHHFFTHCDKCITTLQKIFCKRGVAQAMLMGNNIVRNANDFCVMIFLHSSQDRSQCWSHKWQPEANYDDVRSLFSQAITYSQPVKWIDGIDR